MSGRSYVDADMNAFRRMIAPPQNTSLFSNRSYHYVSDINQPDQYTRRQRTPEEMDRIRASALNAANKNWYKGLFMGIGKTLLMTAAGAGIAAAVVGTGGLALPVMGVLGLLGIGTSIFQISRSMDKWNDTKKLINNTENSSDIPGMFRAIEEYAYQAGDDMGGGATGLVGSVFSLGWFGRAFGALARAPIATRFRSLGDIRGIMGFGGAGAGGASVANAFMGSNDNVYLKEILNKPDPSAQAQPQQRRQDFIYGLEETPIIY